MSFGNFNSSRRPFGNGFLSLHTDNGHQRFDDSSSSESSDSDSDSSSGEFVAQETYSTLQSELKNKCRKPNELKRLNNTQTNKQSSVHQPFYLNKTRSMPIIFERSDEGSVSSQSNVDLDDDSTLSDCSDSSSSVLTKGSNWLMSKETSNHSEHRKGVETTNSSCSISSDSERYQPIIVETNNSIDSSNELSSVSFITNDLPMHDDSLNCNQTSVCNNTSSDTHTPHYTHTTPMTNLDVTHKLIGVLQWNTINKPSSLSQSDLLFNKRTPRFPVKNQNNIVETSDNLPFKSQELEPECDKTMQHRSNQLAKPPIPKKPNKPKDFVEQITDLDDIVECQPDNSNDRLVLTPVNVTSDINGDDSLIPGSYFKNQMFKNYTKTDLKMPAYGNANNNNRLYEKRQEQGKTDNSKIKNKEAVGLLSYDKDSPSKRSQELVGNVVKMDKTINRVTNDIVRIDNAIDKLSQFNKNMMSNLELMSDAELSSDFDTQSMGAQTDDPGFGIYANQVEKFNKNSEKTQSTYNNSGPLLPGFLNNNKIVHEKEVWSSSSSNDSSTEKESTSDSDESIALKPSPVHQRVNKPNLNIQVTSPEHQLVNASQDVRKPHLSHKESDLSTLTVSSYCEEPEKRDLVNKVKYFQKQIKKSAGLYKHPQNIEPPKKLVVEEYNSNYKSPQRPVPKPRNSIDGGLGLNRHLSNSSSESSNFDYNGRTLSNSNNHTQISPSANSDSGSIMSLNSNHFESRFQKGANASARYNSKTKLADKWISGSRSSQRGKMEEESSSLSGKISGNKIQVKSHMPQSRSYNSLNMLNYSDHENKLRSGSLATLNKEYNVQDIDALCNLIQHNLNLNHHDRIRGIFSALIMDNNHYKIEEIIDRFEGDDRALLMELVDEAGYGLKDTESIFDMTMSRTDLHNQLRPGISMSSISDAYYQQNIDNDKMVYWRADIEELLPPPMKPPPKAMPTNLLKSAIISPESLIHVDNKVLEILEFEPTTFTELVTFLTRDCAKDVEKVRALFRWITMYDIKSVNFDPAAPNDTLVGVLRAIKCGQMSNNELFFRMCRFAGIHCQFISGYSKGAGYRPGMAIKDNRMFRNVWTAVFVAGAWRFVNCNWGARYLTSRHQELKYSGTLLSRTSQVQNTELKHRCDEFYFLTDAKQHIFEHFPDKKRWQLLNRPITLDQFMALPIVKSPFFNANLSFKRNYGDILQTKKGKVTVKINMPQAVGISVRLENRADGSILRGLTLARILDNQMIVITAAPSQPGKFYLSIYVNDDWKCEENMEMACSFQIHCSEHNYDRLVTGRFPDVGVLGATPASQNLGIIANPGVDPFVLWEERSTLKLNVAIRPGLRVGQRMMSYDRSGQNSAPCDSYALLQYHNQGRSQYHLRFPIEGFYCLTIYAGVDDPHIPDTEPMECIYRLLIDCKRAQERIPPFPRQTSRWVGFRLIEPLCQHLELNTVYRFRILASQCSSVSVVINDTKWIDLAVSNDGLWKGKVNTGQELENLSVYGKFGSNEDDEFIKLLDYILVAKTSK